ncbi:hypothetical protein D3C81_1161410 [compost metagenome]
MRIEDQKTKHGPDHGCRTYSSRYGSSLHGHYGKSSQRYGADTRQQPIYAIREIDRIGYCHHHENNKRIVEPSTPVKANGCARNADAGIVSGGNQQAA